MQKFILNLVILFAPMIFTCMENEHTKGDMATFILWLASVGVVYMLTEIVTALNEIAIAIMEQNNADRS